jgi:hypothetical protein
MSHGLDKTRAIAAAVRTLSTPKAAFMTMRRKVYWWFRFVLSGRFLETFLNLRPGKRS